MNYVKIIFLSLLVIILTFVVGGIGFSEFVQRTSTTEFCISCHEMKSTVYEEYTKTIHYKNDAGVRASCSDCHVPHSWSEIIPRKIMAARDVYHHLLGTIDTPEKFEAHRLEMAKRVWARMQENRSLECRNCHQFDAMDFEKQRLRAQKQHQIAIKEGKTCIDCHKGIAHKPVHEASQNDKESQGDLSLDF